MSQRNQIITSSLPLTLVVFMACSLPPQNDSLGSAQLERRVLHQFGAVPFGLRHEIQMSLPGVLGAIQSYDEFYPFEVEVDDLEAEGGSTVRFVVPEGLETGYVSVEGRIVTSRAVFRTTVSANLVEPIVITPYPLDLSKLMSEDGVEAGFMMIRCEPGIDPDWIEVNVRVPNSRHVTLRYEDVVLIWIEAVSSELLIKPEKVSQVGEIHVSVALPNGRKLEKLPGVFRCRS